MRDKSPRLCARGAAAAKERYAIYPSAYANAHAASVCRGKTADLRGARRADAAYVRGLRSNPGGLRRWFAERWVNVCGPLPFPVCGRANSQRRDYPYCRPSRRVSSATPTTVAELSPAKLAAMCRRKQRGMRRHRGSLPTRVLLAKAAKKSRS